MRTTHFIVSIGTSIIGNYRRTAHKEIDIHYPTGLLGKEVCDGNTFPAPEWFCTDYASISGVLLDADNRGAEQETIEKVRKLKDLEPEACRYHLIATDTREALFCASFLGHGVLGKERVHFHVPPGLGSADDDKFATRGLPSLLSCVAGILDMVEEKGLDAVIVPTGGYKVMIPYLTIASVLYKHPAFYTYEGNREVMELPAPPLGINISELRCVLVLLENILDLNMNDAAPYYMALPEGYQKLLYLNEQGTFEYTAFGRRLKKIFAGQTSPSPLMLRASQNSLIPYLGEYRNAFRNIAQMGETVWLGDKAPEMADHARHHHTNLFAYAELLLLPIFRDNECFLSQEELYLLLGMIYLHDCGHSLCNLPDLSGTIPLLSTEIRNFHNLLGYLRLNDPAFRSTLQRQGLQLSSSTLENIATVSLYHRKKMPILNGSATIPGNHRFDPLKKQRVMQDGKEIGGDRLALIVSLFRLVDGMDKQVGRAGDALEITMRAESILADLPHLHDRSRRMIGAMRSVSAGAREAADRLLDKIVSDYGLKEAVTSEQSSSDQVKPCRGCAGENCHFEIRSPADFSETAYYQHLQQALAQMEQEHYLPLTWAYLETRVNFFFRALQPFYYYSDLLLGMPRVTHSVNGKVRCITINYPGNDDSSGARKMMGKILKEIRSWITENIPPDYPEHSILNASLVKPKQIVQGIRDEYCSRKYSEVASVLKEAGIIIEFRYNGQAVTCWKVD